MITTSRLLTLIRSAKTFEEAVAYHKNAPDPCFKDELYGLMTARGLTAVDMIRLCGIERSYFYHILGGKKMPGRNIVLRLGLCMRLSLKEMQRLLQLAGTAGLYPRVRRDAVLIYAVQNRYTMEETNELLIAGGEEPLFVKEKNG